MSVAIVVATVYVVVSFASAFLLCRCLHIADRNERIWRGIEQRRRFRRSLVVRVLPFRAGHVDVRGRTHAQALARAMAVVERRTDEALARAGW